jgi:hypothetical protein
MPDQLGRIACRYLAGRPLDGAASRGGSLRRLAWRVGLPAALIWMCAVWITHPVAGRILAAAFAVYGGRRAWRWWRTRRFRNVYLRPTVAALAGTLGDAPVRLHVDPDLGNLMPRLAKPMSPAEVRVRAWYGQHIEPVLRWLPDRAQRGAWSAAEDSGTGREAAGPATPTGRERRATHRAPRRRALPDPGAAAIRVRGDRGEDPRRGARRELEPDRGERDSDMDGTSAPTRARRLPGSAGPHRPAPRVGVLPRPDRRLKTGGGQPARRQPAHRPVGRLRGG